MLTENYVGAVRFMRSGHTRDAMIMLQTEPRDSVCYGLALGQLAQCFMVSGDFVRAETLARKALREIVQRGAPEPVSIIQFHRTLGEALMARRRFSEAGEVFKGGAAYAESIRPDDSHYQMEQP